jgi:hypothetical protein
MNSHPPRPRRHGRSLVIESYVASVPRFKASVSSLAVACTTGMTE